MHISKDIMNDGKIDTYKLDAVSVNGCQLLL